MPKSRRKARITSRIRETLHKFAKTGKIGTAKPKSKRKAQKQAIAIAFAKERRRGRKR